MSVPSTGRLKITKLDGAKRQLDCAIHRWFMDDDALSVHTLAAAAYQIVHDIKLHRKIDTALLYDTKTIKDEYRVQWLKAVRKPANFLKHADTDPEGVLEFHTVETVALLMGTAAGLRLLGETPSVPARAFLFWLVVHKPNWIMPDTLKRYQQQFGVQELQGIKMLPKHKFFDLFVCTRKSPLATAKRIHFPA